MAVGNKGGKMIYYFARPNQMVGHRFTDDVAVCFALTKKKAIEKFGLYYANVKSSEVKLLRLFSSCPCICVLTDY